MKVTPLRDLALCQRLLPVLIAVLGLFASLHAAEPVKSRFDLPADKADRTLKLLAKQSGLEVLFATETTEGVRTAPVNGEMTAVEAARAALAATKLLVVQDERTGAITINRPAAPPDAKNGGGRRSGETATGGQAGADSRSGSVAGFVADKLSRAYLPGAELVLQGTDHAAVSERDGRFLIGGVPPGSYVLQVSYLGYASAAFPVEVLAGQTTAQDAALSAELLRLETFRVEGAREGQARALNEQRSATNIKNLISADAIGDFPDVNAAEALKRIAGVSTVRQRGEDRDITIRGAAPNLNSITIDGVSVMSNQQNGRTVSMDVYPAEQLAGIEVTKSALPSMDADSIGGVINLRSRSAFDAKGRVFAANGYWQYNDKAKEPGYRIGLNYSDIFGAKRQWGIQFSASRALRKALEETTEPAGWSVRSGTASNGAYVGYVPNNIPFTNVDISRTRTGGSLSVERKLGEATRLYLRSSYNEFVERNGRPRFVVQNVGSNISNAAPVAVADDRITGFTSTAVRGQRVVNPRTFTDTGATIALGGGTVVQDWKLSLVGSFTRGTNRQDSITGQWQTTANTTAVFDLTDSERVVFTRTAGPDLNDASAYAFNQLQVQDRRLNNREYSLKADASREMSLAGRPFTLTGGFKYRWSPKRFDQENQQYNTLTSGTLALNDSRLGATEEVGNGFLNGLMAFGPTISPYGFYEFAKANLGLFVPNAGNTLSNTLGSDYYVAETISAGYLMGEWRVGKLIALAGVRYEKTDTESKGYAQNTALATSNPARYSWVSTDDSSDRFMPGVHLRYAQSKNLIFRASWNNTLARAETNRIAPILNVTMPTTPSVSDPVIVSGGNPNLRATTSANYDLSVEYYLKQIGIVSVGYFYKDLDGPIYRRTFDGLYEGNPARFTVFDNAGKASVSGWEFSYQQNFPFLPGPLSGLGIYANYTLVDSDVTLTEPGRVGEKLPLFNQSDELGNLAVTYQKYGVFVRLSHNWRGDYLQALGNPGLDQYARGFESYDLLASYKINSRWTVKFEASNLTASPEEQYVGTSARALYYGDTGRSYAVGVHLNW
jgi:TonB-dependent receptor